MSVAVPPLLKINNVEVIYDHVILVLKGVSLLVPEGGIVALLGANGAGKSTTLKAISNLLHVERGEVTKGSIEFLGSRIDQSKVYIVNLVPASPSLGSPEPPAPAVRAPEAPRKAAPPPPPPPKAEEKAPPKAAPPEPPRPARSVRRYGTETVARLRFIKRAQELGFTLQEVAKLLLLDDGQSCTATRKLAEQKLSIIRGRIADLSRMRRLLDGLIAECDRGERPRACPIIRTLSGKR